MMAWPKVVMVEIEKTGEGLFGGWNPQVLLRVRKERDQR